MKIMHYSLGIPPLRSGGLTKYFWDFTRLSSREKKIENIIVYPMKRIIKNLSYKEVKSIKEVDTDIFCYEMLTNLTIPIVFGIKNTESYFNELTNHQMDHHLEFLSNHKIELIHLHTLMGLTHGFFEAAKTLNIKIIYSSHDYFGICSKTSLFDKNNMNCDNYDAGYKCSICNYDSMSDVKLFLSQKKIFRKVNNVVKKINVTKKSKENFEPNIHLMNRTKKDAKDAINHVKIREVYINIFENYITHFHFNSKIAEKIFLEYVTPKSSSVINITHGGVDALKLNSSLNSSSNIKEKKGEFKILFLGPYKVQKGVSILIKILEEIDLKEKWHLTLYGDDNHIEIPRKLMGNISIKGKYNSENLDEILSEADILVVPSLWKETFGFITLEALAMNVPVLISGNVGARDLIEDTFPEFIYEDEKELREKLKKIINRENNLSKLSPSKVVKKYNEHLKEMISMYEEVLS